MPYIVLDPGAAEAAPTTTFGEPRTSVGKTLADMRARLVLMMAGRDDITTAEIDEAINDSYLDIATSTQGKTGSILLETVVGQPLYLLPSAVANIQSMAVTDDSLPDGGAPLVKIDKASWRRKPTVDNGRPTMYFREGNLLVLYPAPDDVYEVALDFRIRPAKLEAATDSPILDEEWHEAIVLQARHKLYDALEEFDKTPQTNNTVVDVVRRRKGDEGEEQENQLIRSSVPHRDPRFTQIYGYPLYRPRDY